MHAGLPGVHATVRVHMKLIVFLPRLARVRETLPLHPIPPGFNSANHYKPLPPNEASGELARTTWTSSD
jgi:hypothetical protein